MHMLSADLHTKFSLRQGVLTRHLSLQAFWKRYAAGHVHTCFLWSVQVIGISRNEELAWQAVEDLKEEFPGAAISYKVRRGGSIPRIAILRAHAKGGQLACQPQLLPGHGCAASVARPYNQGMHQDMAAQRAL
jgi:hypothetical protein